MKNVTQYIGVVAGSILFLIVVFFADKLIAPSETVSESSQTTTVYIALLDPSNTQSGKKTGCDTIVLVPRTVPKTDAPLSAALSALFAEKDSWPPAPGMLGNFVATRNELNFDHASLQNGTASLYFTGAVGPLGGVCDDPRLKSQLEETVLQFATVHSVRFYLSNATTTFTFSEK